jgi:hypothetical protein
MSLRTRRALPLLFAAALLLAAAPAGADSWRKHHKHHHKHAGHHWKHHGGYGHGGYYAPRVVVRHSYGYPVYHYDHGPESYYCGPCSHYFESYDHLSHHVHQHHHIAAIELPSVIFQASIGGGVGWVFGH